MTTAVGIEAGIDVAKGKPFIVVAQPDGCFSIATEYNDASANGHNAFDLEHGGSSVDGHVEGTPTLSQRYNSRLFKWQQIAYYTTWSIDIIFMLVMISLYAVTPKRQATQARESGSYSFL